MIYKYFNLFIKFTTYSNGENTMIGIYELEKDLTNVYVDELVSIVGGDSYTSQWSVKPYFGGFASNGITASEGTLKIQPPGATSFTFRSNGQQSLNTNLNSNTNISVGYNTNFGVASAQASHQSGSASFTYGGSIGGDTLGNWNASGNIGFHF